MGVKGLASFLEKEHSFASFEIVPDNSLLVIDGNGWMFHLLRSVDRLEPLGRHQGGGYDILHRVIEQEANFLRNDMRCQLIVYFDGPKSKLKQSTHVDRMKQREAKWENLQEYYRSKGSFANNDLPIAPLCCEQIKASLSRLNIPTASSTSEADYDMVCYAREWTDEHQRPAYCVAEDSDFMVLKNCSYIRFKDISSHTDFRYDAHHHRLLPIYRRDTVARRLSLSPAQFVEWCILIGNDYTSSFPKTHFHNSLQKYNVHDCKHATLLKYKEFIKSRGPQYRLGSNNKALQRAIQYSRCYYNLQSLDAFPYDSPTTYTPKHTAMILSYAQIGQLMNWYRQQRMTTVGILAVEYLQGNVDFNISDKHLSALRYMIEHISRLHLHSIQIDVRLLSWEDYEAAYVYQNICRQLMKLVAKSTKDDRRVDQVCICTKALLMTMIAIRSV